MNDVDFLPISNSDYCLFVSKIKKNRYPVRRDPKVGKNCEGEKRRSNRSREEKAKVDWEKCAAATTTSYVHWSHELSATTETGTATQLASNTFTTK